VILLTVAGTSEFWFALPALLAFSAGLAGVLVAIGILVVKFRNFAGSRWGDGRFVRALPIVSACLITVMGLWLCFESTHHR
jgi:ABC-type nickel/cobalt efflux system permease component RcnA